LLQLFFDPKTTPQIPLRSDLNSSNSGCACLGSGLVSPLGVVEKEVAVLVVLVRRHRCAVGAVVRRVVDDEVPDAVEEEAGPAAVRRVPPGLLDPAQAFCTPQISSDFPPSDSGFLSVDRDHRQGLTGA